MLLARGGMRDHIVSCKNDHELRIGATEYCSGGVGKKSTFARFSASFDDGMLTDPEKFSLAEPIKPTKSFDFIATSPKPNSGAFTLRCLRDCYHGPSHGVAITLVFEA
jgi:hypothetical protein